MKILIALVLVVGSTSRPFQSSNLYLGKQSRDLQDNNGDQQCIDGTNALFEKNPTLNQTSADTFADARAAVVACGASLTLTCIIDHEKLDSALPFDSLCVAAGGITYKANVNLTCPVEALTFTIVQTNILFCFLASCDPSFVAGAIIRQQQSSEDSDCVLALPVTVTDVSGNAITDGNSPLPIPIPTQSPALIPTTVTTPSPIPAPTSTGDISDNVQQCIDDADALYSENPTLNQTSQDSSDALNAAISTCSNAISCVFDEDTFDSTPAFNAACEAVGGNIYMFNSSMSCPVDGVTLSRTFRNIRECFSDSCDESSVLAIMIEFNQPSEDSGCVLVGAVSVTDVLGNEITDGNSSLRLPSPTQSPAQTPTIVTTPSPIPAPTSTGNIPSTVQQCVDNSIALLTENPTLNQTFQDSSDALNAAVSACDSLTCVVDEDTFGTSSSLDAGCDAAGGNIYKTNSSRSCPVDGATLSLTYRNIRYCLADSCDESTAMNFVIALEQPSEDSDCVLVGAVTVSDVLGNEITGVDTSAPIETPTVTPPLATTNATNDIPQCLVDSAAFRTGVPLLDQTYKTYVDDIQNATSACGTTTTCVVDGKKLASAFSIQGLCEEARLSVFTFSFNASCSVNGEAQIATTFRDISECFAPSCDQNSVLRGIRESASRFSKDCVVNVESVIITDAIPGVSSTESSTAFLVDYCNMVGLLFLGTLGMLL